MTRTRVEAPQKWKKKEKKEKVCIIVIIIIIILLLLEDEEEEGVVVVVVCWWRQFIRQSTNTTMKNTEILFQESKDALIWKLNQETLCSHVSAQECCF